MAKVETNAPQLSKKMQRFQAEAVKMYSVLAENVFDQLAIDSTANIRIFGGTTNYLRKVARLAVKTKPAIQSKLTSRSGRLVASLNNKVKSEISEGIRKIESNQNGLTLVYGSHVPYALIHDKGGTVSIPTHTRTAKLSATPTRSLLGSKETVFKYKFVKGSTKQTSSKNFEKKKNIVSLSYKVKGYSFTMPARPFVSKAVLALPKQMQKLFDMAFERTIGKLL